MNAFTSNSPAIRGFRQKMHPTEAKTQGGTHLVGRNGEINANDKKELLRNIAHMFTQMSEGQVMQGFETKAAEQQQQLTVAEKNENLITALNDPEKKRVLGAVMADELSETANREGFMRRFFQECPISQGQWPRIRINYKTQFGMLASGPEQIQPLFIRNKWVMPPEFFNTTNILIDEREIVQSTGDILEEKMFEGNEAIMVKEDITFKRLIDGLVGVSNPLVTLASGFTPSSLATMRSNLLAAQLPADTMLFATDVWDDILTNTSFVNWYDPVSQYEIVQTGVIGRLMGLNLVSDAYRVPQLRVLSAGEIYVFPRGEFLGGFTSRGPVQANETNAATNGQGIPARGWFMFEILSMVAHNPAAVVKAQKS